METKLEIALSALSNGELTSRVVSLAKHESAITAVLVAHLAEFDKRHLYLLEGYASMFEYCTLQLNMAEGAAFKRITCARILQQFPAVFEYLRDGSLHISGLQLLGPHLTPEGGAEWLQLARHRTCRQIEVLLAERAPKPDIPSTSRKLPSRAHTGGSPHAAQQQLLPPDDSGQEAPVQNSTTESEARACIPAPPASHRPIIQPLAPSRWRIQFTADAAMHARLREAQELLRHQIPNGDPAAVLDRALIELLTILKRRKFGAVVRPRRGHADAERPAAAERRDPAEAQDRTSPRSRHIPAEVRRAVLDRDGARCTFTSPAGRRCGATGMLEFHHLEPFAEGGPTTIENLTLRCRAHNADEGRRRFGERRKPRRAPPDARSDRPPDEPPSTAREPIACYSFRFAQPASIGTTTRNPHAPPTPIHRR